MKTKMGKPENFAEYLLDYPPSTQKLLKQLREIIRKSAPKADEVISYGMPAYMFHGRLVYFAGYARHIGFYPMPDALMAFRDQLTAYSTSKGTVQFPLDKPLPSALIGKMVKFRIRENLVREALKAEKKKKAAKKKK